jgi:hypothetical protein
MGKPRRANMVVSKTSGDATIVVFQRVRVCTFAGNSLPASFLCQMEEGSRTVE